MSDDQKKPLWPWTVALLIGLPLVYVLSIGPACWISAHKGGTTARGVVSRAYRPVTALAESCNSESALDLVQWYCKLACSHFQWNLDSRNPGKAVWYQYDGFSFEGST